MVSLHLAAALVAISGVGDTVLLDFSATWCGPCRAMEPTIAQLEAAGYPVRKVDIDQDRALASQYRVQSVPTFVLVVDGKEVDRVVGGRGIAEFKAMFEKAGVQPKGSGGSPVLQARGQSPDQSSPGLNVPRQRGAGPAGRQPRTFKRESVGEDSQQPAIRRAPAGRSLTGGPLPTPQALQTCVRLRIKDGRGSSVGSGTIIDAQNGEALILTCGHVFRDSKGEGEILVDVFRPQMVQSIPGRLVGYDLKTDTGLVAIKTNAPIVAARVAPPGYAVKKGDRVVDLGCNNGGDPTARESQVTSLDKFMGPSNLQVANQPVQGRSGGGLFSSDGMVIGVCNAADPADNEGLFAALASIHAQLDQAGLSYVYRPVQPPASVNAMTNQTTGMQDSGAPNMPATMPRRAGALIPTAAPQPLSGVDRANAALATAGQLAAVNQLQQGGQAPEVICIVRGAGDPAKTDVITLERASPAFFQQLAAEQNGQSAGRFVPPVAVGNLQPDIQQPLGERGMPPAMLMSGHPQQMYR